MGWGLGVWWLAWGGGGEGGGRRIVGGTMKELAGALVLSILMAKWRFLMSLQDRFGGRSAWFGLTLGCFLLGSAAAASVAQAGPPAATDPSKLAGAMASRPYALS